MATNLYDTKAQELQEKVTATEALNTANRSQLHRAIVHTRQDVVLMVSYLSSLNGQVATIRRLLWAILVVLLIAIARLWK